MWIWTVCGFRGFRYLSNVVFEWILWPLWILIFRQWISYFVGGFRYLGIWISYILWISIFRQTASPLLKKSTLDKDELSNYRPVSNLFVISKIIEGVVKSRLIDHLTSSKLLNSHQSAYCKHYSTETALLYIHDHLVSAIGSQKVSCLCLLDLSAAFDTIDHNILITRLLSWFGIHGSVLCWFKSYYSSRSIVAIVYLFSYILRFYESN